MRRWLAKHLTGLTLLIYATSGLGMTVIGGWCIPAVVGEHYAHSPQGAPAPCPPPHDGTESCRGQCLDVQPRLVSHAAPHRATFRPGLSPLLLAGPPRDLPAGVSHRREPRLSHRAPRASDPLLDQRHLETVVLIV